MPIRFVSGLVLVVVLICIPAAALAAGPNPTPAQIRTAMRQAGRSPDLWATVNVCNTRHHPDTIGIRGQMPALGFNSELSMTIAIDYWNTAQKRYRLVPGKDGQKQRTLGRFRLQAHQDGWLFPFKPHAGLLRGTIVFQWTHAGKVIGHLTRVTMAGRKHVDQSDPRGHSAATCRIP